MEEDQYRATYHQFNQNRCAFEQSILSRRCNCPHAHKFCLAEREGIACQEPLKQPRCQEFLNIIRQKSLFTLKLAQIGSSLPHAKELRIQIGGLKGLAVLLDNEKTLPIDDIIGLLEKTEQKYGNFSELPFDPIIQQISQIRGRQKRTRKK